MKDFLHFLIENLVSSPDSFEIAEFEDADVKTFTIKLTNGDQGTVIGRGGKTISSLRSLLNVFQATHGDQKHVFLNVE